MECQYEIYVPQKDNEGHPYCPVVLEKYKSELVKKFGGLTGHRQECEGIWKDGKFEYHDEINVWTIIAEAEPPAKDFFREFKDKMEKDLHQKNILITQLPAHTIH